MYVLCVADYFLPGFLGGGPITTLANMRHQLAGEVSLAIFTRDRDLGSAAPYPGINSNRWLETPDGPVYYASAGFFGPRGFRRAFAARDFGLVYLNSFFSPRSAILLRLALRLYAPGVPVLIAPRGEFSPGALAVKKKKKKGFLALARLFGLYRDVAWHASTELEARDILRQFPDAAGRIHIAPDPVVAKPPGEAPATVTKEPGRVRIAFISRISPKKNLDGLIRILATVRAPVDLEIFGPVEDAEYWERCHALIASLPEHIAVSLHGPLAPDEVSATFAGHDLFAFPTHGENFGHVIFEAIRAGTPVLISDQTSWQPDAAGAVTVVPNSDVSSWRDAIETAAQRGRDDQERVRDATFAYAARYASADRSLQANLEMFQAMLSDGGKPRHPRKKTHRSS